MGITDSLILSSAILFLTFGAAQSDNAFAGERDLKPEEVVAAHLKSIGNPRILQSIKSRAIEGSASVKFIQGKFRDSPDGESLMISEGRKLGIIMKFKTLGYYGEYLAFDGNGVTIGNCDDLTRSRFGHFFSQVDGVMKEGLLGGTLSVAWPLLDVPGRQPKLKYQKRKIEGRQLHELIYNPKSIWGTEFLRIRLFFEPESFRHVMTEYKFWRGDTPDSVVLKEIFEDFREVDGLMLPHRYRIHFSSTNFIGHWTIEARHWRHNAPMDAELFKARSLR